MKQEFGKDNAARTVNRAVNNITTGGTAKSGYAARRSETGWKSVRIIESEDLILEGRPRGGLV
jgi:hypothetical protein